MRQTSIDVYNEIKNSGLLSKLRFEVYDALFQAGPMTAQETWHYLRDQAARNGQAKINGITPRFSELLRSGVIKTVGTAKCKITGRNCTVWEVTDQLPMKLNQPLTTKERLAIAEDFIDQKGLKAEYLRGL